MDIQSTESIVPVTMHETVKVWGFIPKFSAYQDTKGTYLEAVKVTLDARVRAEPHYHDTHDFFILEGSAVFQVQNEVQLCKPGISFEFRRMPCTQREQGARACER